MDERAIDHLHKVEMFAGLNNTELAQVAGMCQAVRVDAERTVFKEGDAGNELYIIHEGHVRVLINTRRPDGSIGQSTINVLYSGQSFGELILLDNSHRSATIITMVPTTLIMIHHSHFLELCETNPRIGYRVISNIARDLTYKLRSSNLLLRGNIRWNLDDTSTNAKERGT